MAKSYRCPNCAASLVFDPDVKKMTCAFCATAISPDDVLALEAQDGFLNGDIWDDDASSYLCGNCGAKSITNVNTAATFCAFCGSPSISLTLKDGVKPTQIIPFTFGRDEAEKAFLQWCKGRKFLPFGFTSRKQIDKLSGIYVPFWLFDYPVSVRCTYLQIEETVSASNKIDTEKSKVGYLVWNRIPLDGSKMISDELMECIEPYNYNQLRAFNTKYLSGFHAENYDTSAEDLLMRAFRRVAKYVRLTCGDGKLNFVDKSTYHPPIAEYVFLPVWFLNYSYHGKVYTFAVNGQTGNVAGDQPTSIWKVSLYALGILLLSLSFFGLLGFMLFGGIFA